MSSIRSRLLGSMIAGPAAVLAAGGAVILATAGSSLDRHLDEQLASRARGLASSLSFEQGALRIDTHEADELAGPGARYEFRSPSDAILAGDGVGIPPPADLGSTPVFTDAPRAEGRGRVMWLRHEPKLEPDEDPSPPDEHELEFPWTAGEFVRVGIMIDRGPTDQAKLALTSVLAVVGGGTALVIAGLAAGAVRWGLAPLDRLRTRLDAVDARTSATPITDPRAPRELAPVYAALNAALARLADALERERLFTHAAAHELRTPLAELRTTAEVAARWPDPERSASALAEARTIGLEMESLVEALLTIARADGAVAPGKADLAPIVRDAAADLDSSARSKGLALSLEAPDDAWLGAAPGSASIIARNLIDNAVHHSPPRGRVAIRAGAGWLEVENGPVDLAEHDLACMFEPFWRADAARVERGHAGLGLSVVQRLAHASGLRVAARLEGRTLRMRVEP